MIRKWVAALLAALSVAACSGRASQGECEKAADHMIDIFTAPPVGESGKVVPEAAENAEQWRKNLRERDPTRASLISTCTSKMSSGQATCVLSALDEKSLAACFGG